MVQSRSLERTTGSVATKSENGSRRMRCTIGFAT